ncbi:MAG: enoyl-CoA hydratase/isomerase family protein [Bacteroidetes bacterium]|nr:enoyl-CoA hydratase/isomerase family protein [Bacteroidota bacterium]
MSNLVHIEYNNRVARLIMNRPEKRNALNDEMVQGLKAAFESVKIDSKVKIVILEGAGESFCAGADLAYLQKLQGNTYEENLADSKSLMELFKLIFSFPKPVIANIKGAAIAGGCGLATVCDFSFAEPESTFAYTEVKIGFVPAIVMVFLSKKIGEGKAKDLLLTGRMIKADEAADMGLINMVVEKENIDSFVLDFANKLAMKNSGDSMQLIKEMFYKMPADYTNALEYAAQTNAKARATDDCKRGIAAFLNKEKLEW